MKLHSSSTKCILLQHCTSMHFSEPHCLQLLSLDTHTQLLFPYVYLLCLVSFRAIQWFLKNCFAGPMGNGFHLCGWVLVVSKMLPLQLSPLKLLAQVTQPTICLYRCRDQSPANTTFLLCTSSPWPVNHLMNLKVKHSCRCVWRMGKLEITIPGEHLHDI